MTRKQPNGANAQHSTVTTLALDAVEDSPFQPRLRRLRQSDVQELMDAIGAAGQLSPIVVQPIPEDPDRYWVHSGHRRCAALRFLGSESVQAIVREDLTEQEARRIAVSDNLGREDLTAFEQAQALQGYCESAALSVESAAEELGINRRTAFRLKKIIDSPEPLQFAIRQHGLSARVAELLAKIALKRPKRALKLADKFASGAISTKGLEEELKTGRSRAAPTSGPPKDVLFKANESRIVLHLDLARDERTAEQIRRAVVAISDVLRRLGVEPNDLSLTVADESAGEAFQ